jgi:hypothetical protein
MTLEEEINFINESIIDAEEGRVIDGDGDNKVNSSLI